MKSFGMRARRAWLILTRQAVIVEVNELPKTVAQIIVSVILLLAGIYFIGWSDNPILAQAATGWIGVVVGYWLS